MSRPYIVGYFGYAAYGHIELRGLDENRTRTSNPDRMKQFKSRQAAHQWRTYNNLAERYRVIQLPEVVELDYI